MLLLSFCKQIIVNICAVRLCGNGVGDRECPIREKEDGWLVRWGIQCVDTQRSTNQSINVLIGNVRLILVAAKKIGLENKIGISGQVHFIRD